MYNYKKKFKNGLNFLEDVYKFEDNLICSSCLQIVLKYYKKMHLNFLMRPSLKLDTI